MIVYFLSQSILTLLVFIILLTNSGIPGGVAGMTPFLVAILVLIQFVVGSVLYFVFNKYTKSYKNKSISICLYTLLYEIIAFLISGEFILLNIFKEGYEGQLNKYYSFSSIISGFIILMIVLNLEKKNKK